MPLNQQSKIIKVNKSLVHHWAKKNYEFETFLTIRYDNHGQAIAQHDPNKKKREKGGWTTYFIRIKKKKKNENV